MFVCEGFFEVGFFVFVLCMCGVRLEFVVGGCFFGVLFCVLGVGVGLVVLMLVFSLVLFCFGDF